MCVLKKYTYNSQGGPLFYIFFLAGKRMKKKNNHFKKTLYLKIPFAEHLKEKKNIRFHDYFSFMKRERWFLTFSIFTKRKRVAWLV